MTDTSHDVRGPRMAFYSRPNEGQMEVTITAASRAEVDAHVAILRRTYHGLQPVFADPFDCKGSYVVHGVFNLKAPRTAHS